MNHSATDDVTANWMPVFASLPERTVRTAAHPTEATRVGYSVPATMTNAGKRELRRVGTATEQSDGTWLIKWQQNSTKGEFVMRPPGPGDER